MKIRVLSQRIVDKTEVPVANSFQRYMCSLLGVKPFTEYSFTFDVRLDTELGGSEVLLSESKHRLKMSMDLGGKSYRLKTMFPSDQITLGGFLYSLIEIKE